MWDWNGEGEVRSGVRDEVGKSLKICEDLRGALVSCE